MADSDKDQIFLERRGPVATIVINRPAVRNAINLAMWRVIQRFAADVESDEAIKALILRGAGEEAFSAGADIGEFERCRNTSKQARLYSQAFDGALDSVWSLSKPVIAMIEGVCVGGGLELACCADIRITAEGSRFGIPTARIGVLVGYREMRRLVQLVGVGAASDMLISARILNAEEALRIGLISRVVQRKDLEKTVYDLAADVAGMAPLIHRAHKTIMRAVLEDPSLSHLTPEQDALPFSSFDTEDFQEGRRAFLEKRPPTFKGR